jgi:gamma-glutamyltranspeptidase/glutathione hydrolase
MQDQWTLQFFLNVVDFGLDLPQALDAPSFHTAHFRNSFYPKNGGDGTIFIENCVDQNVLFRLQEMGHRINVQPPYTNGQVCAVRYNFKTNGIEGAASAKYDRVAYAFGW